jgi:ribosomal protein L2
LIDYFYPKTGFNRKEDAIMITMNKRRQYIAWLIAFMMLISAFSPIKTALAATPPTLDADVSVTGVEDGGIINGSTGIEITVTFPVPVMGDGVTDYFEHGDSVTLLLSESFKFDPVPTGSFDLMYGTKKLGAVTLSNNISDQAVATITFDGDEDVFDPDKLPDGEPPYSGVSGTYTADLKYNGTHDTDEGGNKTVSILEKTYKLQLPGDIITYTVEKSGVVDWNAGTIEWTVTITATSDTDPVTHIDLKDYMFEDDLANVGEYVAGSFSLPGGTLVIPDSAASPPTTKLTYTFPAGSISPQTLTFKTEIPDSVLTAGGDITNVAGLYLVGEKVGFDDFKVTITKPSATKSGETNDVSNGTSYDPEGRTITWYIEVDNKGRPLNDLVITDELKGGLIFDSAQWQKWNATESKWEDVSGINWTLAPDANQYKVGEKIGGGVDYVGRLKIVTKVPNSTDGSVIAKTYYNQASVSWSGSGGTTGSTTTGNPGVGIGYDALSKSGTQSAADVAAHQITWTINVDMKGQSAADFKVYDLLVHDSSTLNADLTSATGWPSGLLIGSNNVTRNNGQKFVGVDSAGTDAHLTVTPIHLQKNGDVIATLVEITDLQASGSNQVVLKSQVLDPNIIAGNDPNQRVYNYAALYKGTTFRGQDDAYVNYNNKVLAKELLNRAEVGNHHTTGAGSINANNRTINVANGFHYGYKEVIFRLNVNAAGVNFANVETSLPDGFGDVTVADTLPEGWEFTKFSGGQDYLIYNTTGALSTGSGFPSTGSLTTSGDALDSVSGLTTVFATTGDPRTATFTFTGLDQPYVILVKARPTGDTFDGYLKGANTRNELNTLSLYSDNWTPGESVSQNVRIDSKVLEKALDLSKLNQGILTWTVKYTPFGQEIGSGLEDTLPQGIDLRTDSSGQLIWEQDGSRNINVRELTLKGDGSGEYVEGAELSLDVIKSHISYYNDTRKLTFTFPDKTHAYMLTYVTDITGMPGAVTNAVKLVDADGTGTSTDQSFTITAQQGMATMGRSGYLVVKKTDMSADPLQDAEFTLYNTNADGCKGSARAVRITGSDGTVKFYGLAPGNYILVETQSPDDTVYENPSLEYNVIVGADLKTTVNGSGVITSDNPFVVVNYKDADQVGSLTISKTVSGDGADPTKAFDFTLTLNGAAGAYTYVGHGVPGGTIASGDTVSLAHGQSITIVGLPNGTTYTVTEADYSGDGYATTSTGATGSIVTNTMQTATFTNTRTVGSLTISKTVAGNAGDVSKSFDFMLTLNGAADIPYAYTGHGVPDGTIKSGDTVSLTHGQSITITGLPAGATYTVAETDYSGDGYVTSSTGATGSIAADVTKTALFTNTKTVGSLTIIKTVAGNAGDAAKTFDFTLTLNGATGTYPYTGHGVPDGTIKSGDTVPLAHGQSITITGLPVDATYAVAEADYSGDGYTTVSTGATGSIVGGATQTASFTNTKNNVPAPTGGNLTISKTVVGTTADTAKKFYFRITLVGAPGTYAYAGNGVPDGAMKSGNSISLAHGQSITITGLPVGTTYTVTEADYSGDGYTVVSAGATSSIASNATQTAAFTNTKDGISPSEDTTGSLTISKTVTGNAADTSKRFNFTLTLNGATGIYAYIGHGVPDGTIISGETVSLAHGQSITITGLPVGTTYTVTEKEANQGGYVTSSTGASDAISEQGQTAAFVNSKSGVPKTGDDNIGAIGRIGLMISVPLLLALIGLDFALRVKRRRRYR